MQNMTDPSTASPLGDVNMGDIGAALAAAGSQASAPASDSPNGGQLGGASGGAGATGGAQAKSGQAVQSLDFILDIPLKVTVELGRSKMAIRDILQLAQGSVIELSKFAGEPLEVLVNEKLIVRGEGGQREVRDPPDGYHLASRTDRTTEVIGTTLRGQEFPGFKGQGRRKWATVFSIRTRQGRGIAWRARQLSR
jgi:flagellar motor switch protein FliN